MGSESFINYANSFQTVINLGLGRISALLELMGNPQRGQRFVHVAGTNGKGSVCAMLDAILTAEGLKVGRYTSPNLIRVNERIVVAGEEISDAELNPLLERVGDLCPEAERLTGECPTQFEVWTAAAMEYFKNKKCDIVLLEVGLGGEFDATNVIEENALAVITRVALDHCAYLGNTTAEIARTKCGIMKPGGRTVALSQSEEVNAVIADCAKKANNSLIFASAPESEGHDGLSEIFSYKNMTSLKSALGGPHQIENAAIAIEAALALGASENSIRRGLAAARHRGRLEPLADDIIFDGAHNPNGVEALCAALQRCFPGREKTVIFACMKDKDIVPSLKMLSASARRFIFTRVEGNPRSMTEDELRKLAAENGIDGETAPDLAAALELSEKYSGSLRVICGSLYLYESIPKIIDNPRFKCYN